MYRLRSSGSLSVRPLMSSDSFPLTCANRIHYFGSYYPADTYVGDKRVIIDNVTENFRARKKRGEIILNNLVSTRERNTSSGNSGLTFTSVANVCTGPNIKGTYAYSGAYFAYVYRTYYGPFTNVILITQAQVDSLKNEVSTRCLAERGQSNTNLVESLAEMDKAFAMVASPLENVAKFIKSFRRNGRRRKGYYRAAANSRDFIRFLSSEWLRFRYGINPLISDVKAGMAALEKQFDRKPILKTTRANGQIQKSDRSNGSFSDGLATYNFQRVQTDSSSVRATHYDRAVWSAFDELGLTFQNTIELVWELTHFSFVADWFGNIQDLILANLPRVSMEDLGGVVTERREIISYYLPAGYTVTTTLYTASGSVSDSFKIENFSTVRSIASSDTAFVIKHDFRFDQFKRAADAAALVVQLLQRIGF